ncbi:DUF881 domain-containing protein [Granulicoccus sp. GXG6511]|uniref:DUF881 domain-containing protein n=1 Tax=Granulicoccus sp. GXG6511 TaxID=3381351 RepID=UPI003D7C55F1
MVRWLRTGWERWLLILRDRPKRPRARIMTALVCVVIGLMISVSSLNARGFDLRPGRNTQLIDVIRDGTRRNADLTRDVAALRAEVDELASRAGDEPDMSGRVAETGGYTGTEPVQGPGYTVILTDAPTSVTVAGIDEDLLVVHQQDIQAVANVFWGAGAEAMTIQGQRVVATTGIKCVGNSVVLHGTPYAPPYVISAIGDPEQLSHALATSSYLKVYRQHAEAYNLGYQQKREGNLRFPGFEGAVELQYARAA